MKLFFKGDIDTLSTGLSLLAPELNITVAEGGYTVTAKKEDTRPCV